MELVFRWPNLLNIMSLTFEVKYKTISYMTSKLTFDMTSDMTLDIKSDVISEMTFGRTLDLTILT